MSTTAIEGTIIATLTMVIIPTITGIRTRIRT
jgi:hypothetical protein